jgi:hypothetical protein
MIVTCNRIYSLLGGVGFTMFAVTLGDDGMCSGNWKFKLPNSVPEPELHLNLNMAS